MKRLACIAVVVVAACAHTPDRMVEPFGKNTYRVDDGDGVHYANKFCASKGLVMQPRVQGTAWLDRDVLVFECVPATAVQAPNVQLEDGRVVLDDQRKGSADAQH